MSTDATRLANAAAKLRSRRAKKSDGTKDAKPVPTYIATPTPTNLDRRVPAEDVVERFNRSTYFDSADAEAAAQAILKTQNVWELARDQLEVSIVDEARIHREVEALRQKALYTTSVGQRLARSDTRQRHKAMAARRAAGHLELRATRLESKAHRLTTAIDGTAERVHDQVKIVINHFWLAHQQRALAAADRVGEWRSRDEQIEAAKSSFPELFGAPDIPSVEKIEDLVRRRREALRQRFQDR